MTSQTPTLWAKVVAVVVLCIVGDRDLVEEARANYRLGITLS